MADTETVTQCVLRRSILYGCLALCLTPLRARAATNSVPRNGRLAFQVFRKGAHLGEHTMTFTRDGDRLNVQAEVDITVKFGPLTVLQYRHQAKERWRGAAFVGLETMTVSNGQRQHVTAEHMDDGVRIEPAAGAAYLAPSGAMPLSHWNRQALASPLFNPQDGKPLRETIVLKGEETVRLADGRSAPATRYALTGEAEVDDWYDEDGIWTALRGRVKDGSFLDYRRA